MLSQPNISSICSNTKTEDLRVILVGDILH